jgi:hypothetical protein
MRHAMTKRKHLNTTFYGVTVSIPVRGLSGEQTEQRFWHYLLGNCVGVPPATNRKSDGINERDIIIWLQYIGQRNGCTAGMAARLLYDNWVAQQRKPKKAA